MSEPVWESPEILSQLDEEQIAALVRWLISEGLCRKRKMMGLQWWEIGGRPNYRNTVITSYEDEREIITVAMAKMTDENRRRVVEKIKEILSRTGNT